MDVDEEGTGEGAKYPEIALDLEDVSKKAEFSFRKLLELRPSELPMSDFAGKLAKTDSVYSGVAAKLLENAHKLLDINPIYPPLPMEGMDLAPYERENIARTLNDLKGLGIELDEQDLIASSESEEAFSKARKDYFRYPLETGIIRVAAEIQREYAKTVFATRAYETAKLIANEQSPNLPWYKGEAMFSFIPVATSREYNGRHNVYEGTVHFLQVQDFWGDIGFRLKELKLQSANVEEYFGDKTVVAFHESGHAVFSELFGEDELKKIKWPKDPKEAYLWGALTEGTAIEFEQVGDKALRKMVPKLPPNFNYGPMAVSDRKAYFERTGEHIMLREYLDGHKLMIKLKTQLGIDELPQEEQIVVITNFLKKVDIVEVSKINFSDPRYMKIVEDPINNLPVKE